MSSIADLAGRRARHERPTPRHRTDRDAGVAAALAGAWLAALDGRGDVLPLLRCADTALAADLTRRLRRTRAPGARRRVVAARARRDVRGVEASVQWRTADRLGVLVLRWTEVDGRLRLHVLDEPGTGRR